MAIRDSDLGDMVFDHVEAINNADIINLVTLLDMAFQQLSTCPSATSNETHPADVNIVKSFIARLRERFDHFAGEPILYMPKAHPKPKTLPAPPNVRIVQNAELQNLMYNMSHMRTELLHCEDAEKLNGFHPSTKEVVIDPWLTKFDNFVALMEGQVANPESTWMPDTDIQEPGHNPNRPR
jgi:hypothetical protein